MGASGRRSGRWGWRRGWIRRGLRGAGLSCGGSGLTGRLRRARRVFAGCARRWGLWPTRRRLAGAEEVRIEFSRRILRPRADAVATLRRLRTLGLRTALISDCSADVPVLWPTTPYAEAIDEPLFSCVEGLVKPDPELYLRACGRLGVEPRDCVYVGDGGNHELTGAERVGMRAVLIRTPRDRARSHGSERDTWQGEAIEDLGEIPGLIGGDGAV